MLKPYRRAQIEFREIRDLSEQGKNSRVYVVEDDQLNAVLVVKEVRKADIEDPNEYFSEAQILYKSRHPNVVPVHYACMDDDNVYISMPYFEEGSLNALINTRFLTVRETVRYACQFLTGLHNIHSKKLIHFDIKPDNILIANNNEASVSDFGIAKQTDYSGVAGVDRFYNPMKPPEAIGNDQFTRSFDIYQAGLTLYRMVNGNRKYRAQIDAMRGADGAVQRDVFHFALRNARFPSRESGAFPEHIPQRLVKVIQTCLEVNPDDRFDSVIDITNELSQIEGSIDWSYSEEENGNRAWVRPHGDGIKKLVISAAGESNAYFERNGAKRRIRDYCRSKINRADIKAFLAEK